MIKKMAMKELKNIYVLILLIMNSFGLERTSMIILPIGKIILLNYVQEILYFKIDADEIPNKILIDNLPQIIKENPDNEVYCVPRVNTVEGLTLEHLQKWGWKLTNDKWINWPDYQWRIYKNKPEIRWINKVHEN